MRGKAIGAAVAVIAVCLIVLGRVSGLAIDWAWFSAIGHVDVFWTVVLTKIALFTAVFAASSLLLWLSGALALRLVLRRGIRLSAAFGPGATSVPALPGTPAGLFRPTTPHLPWRLILLGVSLVLGVLIAIGETGQWDLVLRFLYQMPYGKNDPMFGKDIGFYLFSLPAWIALKDWMLLDSGSERRYGGRNLLRPRRHRSRPLAMAFLARGHCPRLRTAWAFCSR